MAQRVQVVLTDDIDGSPADETVTFGLDGVTYEIDLTKKNAAALRKALEQYVSVSRRVGTKTKKAGNRSNVSNAKHMREWLKANGHPDLGERGRIPADLVAKYEAAH